MIELMKILLDPRTLLEYLVHRNDKFECLSEILKVDRSVQLYLSEPGLAKIVSHINQSTFKNSEELIQILKKRIKVLRLTKIAVQKARLPSALDIDYELAIEIHLAIRANIGAIVTHRPSDFPIKELSILTLRDFKKRKKLEINLSKTTRELPAVWGIPLEQIENLNKIFYHSPSYIDIKLLEPKESTSQLDLTSSSDKVSTPSADKLLPQSTNAPSISQIIIDALLNPSTAPVDTATLGSLESERLTCKHSLDTLKASIDQDRLSIKSFARSTAYIDIMKSTGIAVAHVAENPFDKVSKIMLKVEKTFSLAIERLSIKPLNLPSFPQLESKIFGSIGATALQSHENLLGGKLMKDIFPSAKIFASAVDSLAIRSSALQSIGQLESKIFGSIGATALQSHESTLDTLKESIAPVKLILSQK